MQSIELVASTLPMETNLRVNILKEKEMEKALTLGLMEMYSQESTKTMLGTVMASTNMPTKEPILEIM